MAGGDGPGSRDRPSFARREVQAGRSYAAAARPSSAGPSTATLSGSREPMARPAQEGLRPEDQVLLNQKQANAKKLKSKTLKKKELQSRILQLQVKNNMRPDELREWSALREDQTCTEADLAELNAEKARLTMRSHLPSAQADNPTQTSGPDAPTCFS